MKNRSLFSAHTGGYLLVVTRPVRGDPSLTDPNRDFNDPFVSGSDRNRPLGASPVFQLVPPGHCMT